MIHASKIYLATDREEGEVDRKAEMTFAEIGQALGCSTSNCAKAFDSAIKKLRKQPQAVKMLSELAALKNSRVF